MPNEPEDRVTLAEIMLSIGIALIVAPGVIWWAFTIIGVLAGSRP